MKGNITADFLMFIGGVILLLIVLGTVFGKGIAYNMLGFAAEAEPTHLQEDLRTFAAAASYSPGSMEVGIKSYALQNISIYEDSGYYVQVTPLSGPYRKVAPIPLVVKDCGAQESVIDNTITTNVDNFFFIIKDDCAISEEVRGQ